MRRLRGQYCTRCYARDHRETMRCSYTDAVFVTAICARALGDARHGVFDAVHAICDASVQSMPTPSLPQGDLAAHAHRHACDTKAPGPRAAAFAGFRGHAWVLIVALWRSNHLWNAALAATCCAMRWQACTCWKRPTPLPTRLHVPRRQKIEVAEPAVAAVPMAEPESVHRFGS